MKRLGGSAVAKAIKYRFSGARVGKGVGGVQACAAARFNAARFSGCAHTLGKHVRACTACRGQGVLFEMVEPSQVSSDTRVRSVLTPLRLGVQSLGVGKAYRCDWVCFNL